MLKNEFISKALQLGKENGEKGGLPYGAVITKDDEILSTGVNEVNATNDPILHAEIVAIQEATKILNTSDLEGCILYASNEPCSMCLSAIYWTNIKEVYYSIPAGDFSKNVYGEIKKTQDKRSVIVKQI